MNKKFIKKQVLLSVILGAEFEMYELIAPNGQTLLLTQSYDDVLSWLRSDADTAQSASLR